MSARASTRGLSRRDRRALVTGILFISPWIIGFLAFRLYPFFASLYYSFTFFPILQSPKWIGLDNFRDLLTDTRFITSLYNSTYYAALAVPLGAIVGILLAMLLNMRVRGLSLFRTIFF